MAAVRAVGFTVKPTPEYGGYQLDAFVVELGHDASQLDFRFELGSGLGIYWALPAGRNEMLRLLLVDGAAFTVDEPELHEAPWRADVAPLEWKGQLGTLGNGDDLVSVRIEAWAKPAGYRCELVTRSPDGREQLTALAWRE